VKLEFLVVGVGKIGGGGGELPDDEKIDDGGVDAQAQAQHGQLIEKHETIVNSGRLRCQFPRVCTGTTLDLGGRSEREDTCKSVSESHHEQIKIKELQMVGK